MNYVLDETELLHGDVNYPGMMRGKFFMGDATQAAMAKMEEDKELEEWKMPSAGAPPKKKWRRKKNTANVEQIEKARKYRSAGDFGLCQS